MANVLYYLHSGTRWLVVAAIIAALGFMIYSLVTNRQQDRATRIIMIVFSGFMGLQWIIGLLLFLVYGSSIDNYNRPGWANHLTTMTVALIAAHMYIPFRRRAGARTYYIASIVVLLVTTILIIYGVSFLIGQGRWSFAPLYPPVPSV